MRALVVIILITLSMFVITKEASRQMFMRPGVASFLTEKNPPAGFAYATDKRTFSFPGDHGQHPKFRSEWWYFTGNISNDANREFGFQLTLFRFALNPKDTVSESPWRKNDIFMGHFAISDIEAGVFHSFERQSRSALHMAGVADVPLKLWIRDWTFDRLDGDGEIWRLKAHENGFEIDLLLRARRPITLQGEDGLSKKNHLPGNASYYYSITRLASSGTISTPGGTHTVTGDAWFDHEWSTSALAEGQLGWDWFSLQLDDQREIMFYQIRNASGQRDQASHGIIVSQNGSKTRLNAGDLRFRVEEYWHSAASGARYPARWRVEIPAEHIDIIVTPRFHDQEWRKNFTYWEGAVAVSGVSNGQDVHGKGYVELVGYE